MNAYLAAVDCPSLPGPHALRSHLDLATQPVEIVTVRVFAMPGQDPRALTDWFARGMQAYVGRDATCYRVSDDACALVIDDAVPHDGTRLARGLAEKLAASRDPRATAMCVRMSVSRAEPGGRSGREALQHAAEKLQRVAAHDPVRVTPARGVSVPQAPHYMELLPVGDMI